jgi:hypothetical protein
MVDEEWSRVGVGVDGSVVCSRNGTRACRRGEKVARIGSEKLSELMGEVLWLMLPMLLRDAGGRPGRKGEMPLINGSETLTVRRGVRPATPEVPELPEMPWGVAGAGALDTVAKEADFRCITVESDG